jgi:hypothetical protein
LANPCRWPPTHRIGAIHWTDPVGGANRTPWWWCLWGELCCCLTDYSYYSYRRKSTGREFFVPARTLIGVSCYVPGCDRLSIVSTINYPSSRCRFLFE